MYMCRHESVVIIIIIELAKITLQRLSEYRLNFMNSHTQFIFLVTHLKHLKAVSKTIFELIRYCY